MGGSSSCCSADGLRSLFGGRGSSGSKFRATVLRREGALRYLPDNSGRVPSDKYDIVNKKLGEGAYGIVKKATVKGVKEQTVALKVIHKAAIPNINAFVVEVEINADLDHPNIVKLFETFEDKNSVYLALEMCRGGEMFDAIIEKGHFTEGDAAALMIQILRAVFHCHTKCIAHRDLKPENFLLQDKGVPVGNNTLKVIDFGIAKRFHKSKSGDTIPMTTRAGTAYYLAPEVLQGRYCEKCDVWSCGVILYILLCGSPPFAGDTDDQIFRLSKRGQVDFGGPEFLTVSKEAKVLIKKMLDLSPLRRISIKQALNDAWVQQPSKVIQAKDHHSGSMDFIKKLRNFTGANRFKKAALHVIAHRLDDKKIQRLKEAFMTMDKNNDGQLTLPEVKDACATCGVSDKEVNMLFAELDTDHSGEIGYTEFLAAMIESNNYLDESMCREAFRIFDRDGNESISLEELQDMLQDQTVKNSDAAEVINIFKEADKDGNGEISFKEFMTMMRGNV